MLDESPHPGTARGLIEEKVDLKPAQYTPRDLILAAWKIKENLNLDFKGGMLFQNNKKNSFFFVSVLIIILFKLYYSSIL